MRLLLPGLLTLILAGCTPDEIPEREPQSDASPPSAAERLAELGRLASDRFPSIRITGSMGDATFAADYAPEKETLDYELKIGGKMERITVSPGSAIFSKEGSPDRQIDRENAIPNGKDWPYTIRMAAPFLDAIDGYAATQHSFHIAEAEAPAGIEGGDSLEWFKLTSNRDHIHDLMFLELSKVSLLRIGIDPNTGLTRSLHSTPSSETEEPAEIRLIDAE